MCRKRTFYSPRVIRRTDTAGKYKQIREILEPLPERRFDQSIVRVPYVKDYGTAYVDAYEQVCTTTHMSLRAAVVLVWC